MSDWKRQYVGRFDPLNTIKSSFTELIHGKPGQGTPHKGYQHAKRRKGLRHVALAVVYRSPPDRTQLVQPLALPSSGLSLSHRVPPFNSSLSLSYPLPFFYSLSLLLLLTIFLLLLQHQHFVFSHSFSPPPLLPLFLPPFLSSISPFFASSSSLSRTKCFCQLLKGMLSALLILACCQRPQFERVHTMPIRDEQASIHSFPLPLPCSHPPFKVHHPAGACASSSCALSSINTHTPLLLS